MKWSRELRIARRSMRTAIKAASAMAKARAKLPAPLRVDASVDADPPTAVARSDRGGRLRQQSRPADDVRPCPGRCRRAGGAADRAAARLRPGRDRHSPATPAGPHSPTGWGCPSCFRNSRARTTRGGASTGSDPSTSVADAVRRCRSDRWSPRRCERFGSDPSRVFIAGLSAGGAMAAALLAAYPDVFAAGAVVAGLPVGAASSTTEALRRMAEAGPARSPAAWAELVRRAAPIGYPGPWPRLSIWHGEDDRWSTRPMPACWPSNGRLCMASSRRPRRRRSFPARAAIAGPATNGRSVELWSLPGLSHAWPMDAVRHIAEFWRHRRWINRRAIRCASGCAPMHATKVSPMSNEAIANDVIVADNDYIVRGILRSILDRHGFSVLQAVDGLEAIDYATRTLPGLSSSTTRCPSWMALPPARRSAACPATPTCRSPCSRRSTTRRRARRRSMPAPRRSSPSRSSRSICCAASRLCWVSAAGRRRQSARRAGGGRLETPAGADAALSASRRNCPRVAGC